MGWLADYAMYLPVVGFSIRFTCGMSKLMFDVIRTDMQDFIKDGPRYCTEAVASHGIFVITRLPQYSINGIFRHGPGMCVYRRENETTCPGIFLQFLQYSYRLIATGYDVGLFHLFLRLSGSYFDFRKGPDSPWHKCFLPILGAFHFLRGPFMR